LLLLKFLCCHEKNPIKAGRRFQQEDDRALLNMFVATCLQSRFQLANTNLRNKRTNFNHQSFPSSTSILKRLVATSSPTPFLLSPVHFCQTFALNHMFSFANHFPMCIPNPLPPNNPHFFSLSLKIAIILADDDFLLFLQTATKRLFPFSSFFFRSLP
jgi:hypothetical protein